MTESIQQDFWQGRRVFLTGHTGFKGAWLGFWLKELGADVFGYALAPAYSRGPYEASQLSSRIQETLADINDAATLHSAMQKSDPQVVFHLAAQPLVGESYEQPVDTFRTNIMGTINLLAGLQGCPSVEAVVVVTTDKCYENREQSVGYVETDPLGGHDPYSSSKACAELIATSWYKSFLATSNRSGLATARAGNVIGGGDWSRDRLVPDVLRALEQGNVPRLRRPQAIRPWQYVLDPLGGYLQLAQELTANQQDISGAWNFGPASAQEITVGEFVDKLLERLAPQIRWERDDVPFVHETSRLTLDCSKARDRLGWRPRFGIDSGLDRIAAWQRCEASGEDLTAFMRDEVHAYMAVAERI